MELVTSEAHRKALKLQQHSHTTLYISNPFLEYWKKFQLLAVIDRDDEHFVNYCKLIEQEDPTRKKNISALYLRYVLSLHVEANQHKLPKEALR